MTRSCCVLTFLALALAVAPLSEHCVAEDGLADAVPAYSRLEGIYYVTLLSHHVNGIYIVDPRVVQIGPRSFLAGREAGGEDGKRETEFSGGTAYVDLRRIVTVQQVPQAE